VLSADEIRRLIPHGGAMCMLERVVAWDAGAIACRALSHRAAGNPLARDGRVPALCGIEYGLQAMAVHGALVNAAPQPVGYLARLGDVALAVDWLDELGAELVVEATLTGALPAGYSYEFAVAGSDAGGGAPIRGRATIALIG
jgi:predicted hotdog family 3-hydroxylacyl-ACP dehydratase